MIQSLMRTQARNKGLFQGHTCCDIIIIRPRSGTKGCSRVILVVIQSLIRTQARNKGLFQGHTCCGTITCKMLKESMAYRKSLDYISMLSDFLYGYNARPHTAFLPFAPREVNKSNEAQVHELQYSEYLRQQKAKHKYPIGDHMRKAINKGAFSKSYKFKNFSEKLYEIIDTIHTSPPPPPCTI